MVRQVSESLEQVWNSWGSDASFSHCGNYRWWLKRHLNQSLKTIVFVGLNPSKANKYENDATLKRIISFAGSWGYGRLLVVNLFARVAKSPATLRRAKNPIGSLNDSFLLAIFKKWSQEPDFDLWLGWGEGGAFLGRSSRAISMLKPLLFAREIFLPKSKGLLSLGSTRCGHPRHPLYLSANLCLTDYEQPSLKAQRAFVP